VKLTWNHTPLRFVDVPLHIEEQTFENVFARYKRTTLGERVTYHRYAKLAERVYADYADYLARPLGQFLLHLKEQGDSFYQAFLNPHGDKTFSRFSITGPLIERRGLYIYTKADDIHYIGHCLDAFPKRVNTGYGRISPKNCYIYGQSTNCHLNALVTSHRDTIGFAVCMMHDEAKIKQAEVDLITSLSPAWNVALR
jgi:hypothetical protein